MLQWKKGPRFQSKDKTSFARKLRNNMTREEKELWYLLRTVKFADYKFRRQVPFNDYILDFYCAEKKVAVELDGSQHFDQKGTAQDQQRDHNLMLENIKVLRYSNRQFLAKKNEVLEDIYRHLSE